MIRRKIIPRLSKKKGWYVFIPIDFRSPSAPQFRRYFGNGDSGESDAKIYAKQLTEARKSHGNAFLTLPIWQQMELLRMGERIGWNNLKAAADMFEERKPLSQLGIPQVAADCIAEKRKGGVREKSLKTLKTTFDSFGDYCGKTIGAIVSQDIEGWRDSRKWASMTLLRRLGDLSTLFAYAKRQKMITENPCDNVTRPRVSLKAPKILSVDEIKKLLRACQKHDVAFLGWMAPVMFGGLRPTESLRMEKGDMTKEVIALESGDQTKLNNRRAFEIQPVLKAWMAVKGVKIGQFNEKQKDRRLAKIAALAEVTVPRNSLRKSCASYWVKLVGSKEASRILGHSETMLHKNYANNKVTMADAKRFEALRPLA